MGGGNGAEASAAAATIECGSGDRTAGSSFSIARRPSSISLLTSQAMATPPDASPRTMHWRNQSVLARESITEHAQLGLPSTSAMARGSMTLHSQQAPLIQHSAEFIQRGEIVDLASVYKVFFFNS